MRFSRQEHWSTLPCPPPGDCPDPGIKPESLTFLGLQAGSLPLVLPGNPFSDTELLLSSWGISYIRTSILVHQICLSSPWYSSHLYTYQHLWGMYILGLSDGSKYHFAIEWPLIYLVGTGFSNHKANLVSWLLFSFSALPSQAQSIPRKKRKWMNSR